MEGTRERRRRSIWIVVVATAAFLAIAIGLYLLRNPVGEAVPTAEAPAPRAAGPRAAASAPEPAGQIRGEAVQLEGTVVSSLPDSFILDGPSGPVTIEVDDADPLYREGWMVRAGDRVTIAGRRDGTGRIEARSVTIEGFPAPIRASPVDEEGQRDGAAHK